MQIVCATLVIMLCGISAASAEIRISKSWYEDGTLVVAGQTEPNRTVTLDRIYTTKSNGDGHFEFHVGYKPPICMSDIRAGDDVYSAVIAGCFDAK